MAIVIGSVRSKPVRVLALAASVGFGIGILVYYKYWNLLADTVGGCCACSKGGSCVTSGCSIEYLRPANGSKIYCTATPKKLGRTLSVVALEMTNDQGAVVATATYTFFMMH